MLMMAEVLHPSAALVAAIGGGDRPDRLERHDQKEKEKDENPTAHCGGFYVITRPAAWTCPNQDFAVRFCGARLATRLPSTLSAMK